MYTKCFIQFWQNYSIGQNILFNFDREKKMTVKKTEPFFIIATNFNEMSMVLAHKGSVCFPWLLLKLP